jgi:hypothetical protein
MTDVNVFLKIRTNALDGAIKNVVFFNTSSVSDAEGGGSTAPWNAQALKRFAGASDYYQLDLPTTGCNENVGCGTTQYTGAFYVETDKGTRYWVKAGDGKDFTFDPRLTNDVGSQAYTVWLQSPQTAYTYNLPMNSIPKTANYGGSGQYLNSSFDPNLSGGARCQ